jgi:hypothetical protein
VEEKERMLKSIEIMEKCKINAKGTTIKAMKNVWYNMAYQGR